MSQPLPYALPSIFDGCVVAAQHRCAVHVDGDAQCPVPKIRWRTSIHHELLLLEAALPHRLLDRLLAEEHAPAEARAVHGEPRRDQVMIAEVSSWLDPLGTKVPGSRGRQGDVLLQAVRALETVQITLNSTISDVKTSIMIQFGGAECACSG